jgi:hypothetical protein
MENQPWKDSKTVQLAVGATLIIVFAWWMFTGDIPFLSQVAFSKPAKGEDGNVQAVEWLPVVWGMLFQACVIVGASAIGLFTGIWSAIVKSFAKTNDQPAVESQSMVAASSSAAMESPDGLIRGLAKAVATNDTTSKSKFETQIRRPYATTELVEAVEGEEWSKADELLLELKSLAGVVSSAKKGGAK